MGNFIGINLGTWTLQVVLMSESNALIATVARPMMMPSSFPDWAEQSAHDWWRELCLAMDELAATHETEMGHVRALCATGHAHALLALDEKMEPLRSAILWNDKRSMREMEEISALLPYVQDLDISLDPFLLAAGKCLWLRRNEPSVARRISKLCFGNDWLTFRLSGNLHINHTETNPDRLLDGTTDYWHQETLSSFGIDFNRLPKLAFAGNVAGVLRSELAQRWHIRPDAVVGVGCTDRAALMVGTGAVTPGSGVLNIGMSGVLAICSHDVTSKAPDGLSKLHHALPDRTQLRSQRLLGTGGFRWISRVTGVTRDDAYLSTTELEPADRMAAPLFVPFKATRRTRSSGKHESGTLIGVGEHTSPTQLAYATQEGVAFEFRTLVQAFRATGMHLNQLSLIGDGARQSSWGDLLANCLDIRIETHPDSDYMAAAGAARLARMASGDPEAVACAAPALTQAFMPQPTGRFASVLNERHEHYLRAQQLVQEFSLPSI